MSITDIMICGKNNNVLHLIPARNGRNENENSLSVISQCLTLRRNRTGFYYNKTVDLSNDVIFAKTFI